MMDQPVAFFSAAACNPAAQVRASLERVLQRNWYVLGEEVASFERAFAGYCGAESCVALASGTDALELALRASGVRRGDVVVLAANAGFYGSTAVHTLDAQPLYVDVDENTLTLSAAGVADALKQGGVKAVIVTHLYGQLADIDSIALLCREQGVPLIEDCAQSHGAMRGGRRCGSFGDIGCFSFYPTKNLGALGDGGAVVTNDAERAQLVRSLRQYGWSSKYTVTVPNGRNSRLDELQAAALRVKLPHLDGWNARRREIVAHYAEALGDGVRRMVHGADARSTAYVGHLAVMLTEHRDADRAAFTEAGIRTDVHYPVPDHRQPVLVGATAEVRLPVTERAAEQVLTLPCFPEMTEDEIGRVCDVLRKL
jgi:dTDP-4-amino-4,6-dideoxygalactose transaminase